MVNTWHVDCGVSNPACTYTTDEPMSMNTLVKRGPVAAGAAWCGTPEP